MDREKELFDIINAIEETDKTKSDEAEKYIDSLIKPPRSLGKLEKIAISLAGITKKIKNNIDKKRIVVLCADNGVVSEGVSSAPVSVTLSQAVNMTRKITGMSSMAEHFGIETEIVDVGISSDYNCPEILDRRIREGTGNIAVTRALEREEVIRAILTGVECADRAKSDGVDILGVGEMGIGNTTTSAAVLAAISGLAAFDVVGRGGGLTDEAFEKKKNVVDKALFRFKNECNSTKDIIEILGHLGGLDIAAMCGVFLGAAKNRIPVVIDGYISIVAALCATKLNERVSAYLFPSHKSKENGYKVASKLMKMEPWLDLDMGLGEGSGCVLAFQVIEAACAFTNNMATFKDGGICDDYLKDIRKQER
ncbi:MAG: nicotinate-nucleotide--dimethylbenzimidazole phosphoribosyltransferase [Butyrivibrio sp.]|uniref:nicotinate-nucleotide--dimethylbenzimidazole phosphoribosyltransferase n=1 Tax=Butyrivibrio sp. TaxID=28121 RepID=UPI001B287369|nr:nicotinate-nucleotide--dimethylbenzimidazole phosphoribosyltransferase [Butyrivibrio sp.]MBO6240803.1 nicotinate-nucleotide--dimethylbenzimidazole phosphoribosyltransferase [Butyrivibrio sp.]